MYLLTVALWLVLLTAAPLPTTAYSNDRLPKVLQPANYNLRIITHLNESGFDGEFYFTGVVAIQFKVLEKIKNITLHSKGLEIDESETMLTNVLTDADSCIDATELDEDYDFYIIHLCEQLEKDDEYVLQMSFKGQLNTALQGYYRTSYHNRNTNAIHWLAVTQFEPASARTAFPCFDEPEYKTKFTIMIGHHKNYTALSNMPLKTTTKLSMYIDWVWSEFEESVPMSTYLVAYSVNDFDHVKNVTSLSDKVRFDIWARPDAVAQCNYAASVSPKILQYYEKIFELDFPLPKIDQMAVPNLLGLGMENWGLITYQELALLYVDERASRTLKEEITYIIAHELAHQWFGNLVTMKWWTDLWLNEGFATYMASLGADQVIPESNIYLIKSIEDILRIFHIDALHSSRAVSQPIYRTYEIMDKFDEFSYKKGSVILRMMHLFLGDKNFFAGIQSYLQLHSYKNADQDDLWNSFIAENFNIKRIMDSWTLQAGYPVITVTRDYDRNTAIINQERYMHDTMSRNSIHSCWWIPLTFTTKKEANFEKTYPSHWLECNRKEKSVAKTIQLNVGKDEWIIFNLQLSGLYKVKYDEQNWNLLIQTLVSNDFEKIHPINRAQLIENALSLAWSGEHSYEIALRLIEYLKHERKYIPWHVALVELQKVVQIMRPTSQFGPLRKYVRSIFTPIYTHLRGMNISANDTKEKYSFLHLKSDIAEWACYFEVTDCVARAQEHFINWQKTAKPDEKNPIPSDLRSVVYCTAVRHGGEIEWSFLWQRYENSNVESEQIQLLTTLACSREVWIIQRLLEWTFHNSTNLNEQHAFLTFDAIVKNSVGYLLAKDYFLNNFNALLNLYNVNIILLFNSLVGEMSSRSDYKLMKAFVEQHNTHLGVVYRQVHQALETLKLRAQWKERNYKQITLYLQNRAYDTTI